MMTPNLYEKAMLVKLTSHKPTLFKRQDAQTEQLQQLSEDKAAAAYVKLFKFKTPVQEAMNRHREVIRLHHRLTLPYDDRGPRLLPNAQYLAYTQAVRGAMDAIAEWFDQHRDHYATYVGADCAARGWKVQPDQYPTIVQFEQALSHDVEFLPMPHLTHFLFDLSPEDRAAFEARQAAIAVTAANDALDRVRKPLDILLSRLQSYAGQPGQRFHGSLLTNVTSGLEDCERLMVQDLPTSLQLTFSNLRVAFSTLTSNLDLLRESGPARETVTTLVTQALITLQEA